MTTVYIADTGVFVRCGGPNKEKFQRLRRTLRQADVSLRIPQRVYEELGGDPAADEYPSGNIPYPDGFNEGWIVVADESLDATKKTVDVRSLVSGSTSSAASKSSDLPSASGTFWPQRPNLPMPVANVYLSPAARMLT